MPVELRTLAAAVAVCTLVAAVCALAVAAEAFAPVVAEAFAPAVAEAFAPVAAVVFAPPAVAPVSLRGRRYRVPMLVRAPVATSRAQRSAMAATDPRPLPTRQERQGSM
jgi:hypothetical protein